jgi:asparagine synthase (glutamine-hydrolysing)
MCGFAAILDLDGRPLPAPALRRMSASLVHRGPDDEGSLVDGPLALTFRRLAILDLSPAGHQPMTSADGRLTIVFNGEIFNYVELRDELRSLGYTFRSSGDTEVLLQAYHAWGAECLPRLNGMWSFLVWDRAAHSLFGSRDRFGIKPLYVHRRDGCWVLASEIKAIHASGLYDGGPDPTALADYLLCDSFPSGSRTFHARIEEFPAGCWFSIDRAGRMTRRRFWDLAEIRETARPSDPRQAFAELFEDGVRLRLRSDVPVGVCLSGGLDSTSILCAMARERKRQAAPEPLYAFSFNDREFDESRYLSDTIAHTAAELRPLVTDAERLWRSLEDVLRHHDEPVHSMTALIGFELLRLAAQAGVKVVLNGQGADEVLGGYPGYRENYWYGLLARGRWLRARREIAAYARHHGLDRGRLWRRACAKLAGTQLGRLRRLAGGSTPAARLPRARWFAPELARHLSPAEAPGEPTLRAALRHSVDVAPLPLYLRIEDRNSMAHSIEARLPFLDWRLVRLAFQLPDPWKLRGPWNKLVLRESMAGRIPESVRTRLDKMGFPTPAARWFREGLERTVSSLLADRVTRERGIHDVERIRGDLQRHAEGQVDVASDLFAFAQAELWCRGFDRSVALAADERS